MNTQHNIDKSSLPSNGRLIFATLLALLVAGIVLITIVLPAEYGIDHTGVGKLLGLQKMGEIKVQLEKEADDERAAEVLDGKDKTRNGTNTNAFTDGKQKTSENYATRDVLITPGQAAEIKVAMKKDQRITYTWKADTGHLNFDVHGDNANVKYFNYSKGKNVTRDIGNIIAEFDGNHGWFWRNRSEKNVTVTLVIRGQFGEVIRVL